MDLGWNKTRLFATGFSVSPSTCNEVSDLRLRMRLCMRLGMRLKNKVWSEAQIRHYTTTTTTVYHGLHVLQAHCIPDRWVRPESIIMLHVSASKNGDPQAKEHRFRMITRELWH